VNRLNALFNCVQYDASKVQIVVVYKVDRLTRSLSDFAKIVDVLDAHNASFVSVTQQFNTTTSMGRLTLNMLCPSLEMVDTSDKLSWEQEGV
jgi:DNA invertase Pin-like site-specific DNA recombinase